jgi:dTDP-4-amino-4,6-dideoxygalactose transaminase
VLARRQAYDHLTDGERRRMFASHVEQALPEATSAPLVVYRLYPRAVRIATALAFGDRLRASDIRNEQIAYLPVIADCHECHGVTLDNGEVCKQCGNPLWKLNWMNATD